ncbi:MAG: hypothetical protein ACREFV_02770 [Acetobacteraceae bacterium]
MGLPSPEQLDQLSKLVVVEGRRCNGNWDKFTAVLGSLLQKVAPSAAQSGVTQVASAVGVNSGLALATGISIAPIGAAIGPWIAAAAIATQAGKIFDLHDLKADAARGGSQATDYGCACANCARNIGYIIDKKERNVGIVAVSAFTFGVAAILKGIHSVGKSLHSKATGDMRPKERTCRDLIVSARRGCTAAMGTIFLLAGSWSLTGSRDSKAMATAVAIITSEDGWEKFKGLW